MDAVASGGFGFEWTKGWMGIKWHCIGDGWKWSWGPSLEVGGLGQYTLEAGRGARDLGPSTGREGRARHIETEQRRPVIVLIRGAKVRRVRRLYVERTSFDVLVGRACALTTTCLARARRLEGVIGEGERESEGGAVCGAKRSKEVEMISKWTPLPAGVERSVCGAERSKEIEMISKWTPLPAGGWV
jgi:hypothetical protein